MKTLVLFDVDGTLTKSRLQIEQPMINCLQKLKKVDNVHIGIVGGSNLNKQIEQLGQEIIDQFKWVFSENGLVAFENGKMFHSNSILDTLGENKVQKLINTIFKYMSSLEIPKKRGNFIEFRTGMINCSPVGRSCSQDERMEFYEYDNKFNIRKDMSKYLGEELKDFNLSYSLGGQISIDIFPKGWDKTYCLQFVRDKYDEILFYGDKTTEGGNDFEIYNSNETESYCVTSPEHTIELLNKRFNLT